MIVAIRRSFALVVLLVAAGCSASPSSPSPNPNPTASSSPTTVPASPPSSASPSLLPTPTPMASIAATSPAPSVGACATLPQTVALPTDRFVDIKPVPGPTADRLVFVFGNASLPGPPTPPQGSLEVARPPYTQAASGKPIRVAGDHVVQVRFTGMSLANDVGQPTYDGRTDIRVAGTALKQAVLFDASEGVIGWYVGYDGSGCVAMTVGAHDVTLVIAHR